MLLPQKDGLWIDAYTGCVTQSVSCTCTSQNVLLIKQMVIDHKLQSRPFLTWLKTFSPSPRAQFWWERRSRNKSQHWRGSLGLWWGGGQRGINGVVVSCVLFVTGSLLIFLSWDFWSTILAQAYPRLALIWNNYCHYYLSFYCF